MRTSVTALDNWQECQVKYVYRGQRLKEYDYVPSGPLTSGITFHDSVERALMTHNIGEAYDYTDKALPDGNRFKPGVMRMIDNVPNWLLGIDIPVAEDKIEIEMDGITYVGKPDLWTVTDEGVIIYEFKTCSEKSPAGMMKKLLNYEEWGIQPIRYAWLLRQGYSWLAGMPFYRQHILWSTQSERLEGKQILMTPMAIDNAGVDMVKLGNRIKNSATPIHHFSPLCNWCDYQQICKGWLTGADTDGIIAEKYYEEEYIAH